MITSEIQTDYIILAVMVIIGTALLKSIINAIKSGIRNMTGSTLSKDAVQ